VGLETNTVDANTGSSEVGDEDGSIGGLCTGPFNVVVVVEQFDRQVVVLNDLGSLLESESDVVRSDGVVPDVGGPWVRCSWRVTQCLVDDVPVQAGIAEV